MQQSYVENLSERHHEKPERLRFSGFFIINLEHVYNWVDVSTSDNVQFKKAGKDINIWYVNYIYMYMYITYICIIIYTCVYVLDNVTKNKWDKMSHRIYIHIQ